MDQGAHFHRCDFQVHSPRDTNWNGHRPVTAQEREEYAEAFVAECRARGLDAVAITDHHDFAFFDYIKKAAEAETDDIGFPLEPSQQLIVFPGMELTLGLPCQAIMVLDASFPTEFLPSIYSILSIDANDPALERHAPTIVLEHLRDLTDLCQRLDENQPLRGRYILLPNVSENGHKTLLRSGYHAHYKQMPCVGGYTDGAMHRVGTGAHKIVTGQDRNYGNKTIGVFPTSDSRSRDFRKLGNDCAWVKWAEPTAEALRQACLASKTRILHSSPQLPKIIIQSLEVTNSRFLGPVELEFNSQYNCLIGGRGTGKSTILEYIRWALCDQPTTSMEMQDEVPDSKSKRAKFITSTLGALQGTVTVGFTINGVRHSIRRESQSGKAMLKIATSDYRECLEQEVRDLLPIRAYSQKQLSGVAVRTDELTRFIESPIQKELEVLGAKADDEKSQVRMHYQVMRRKKALQKEILRESLEADSLQRQIEVLRSQLLGLEEPEQQILALHDAVLSEEQLIGAWSSDARRVGDLLLAIQGELARLPRVAIPFPLLPHDADLRTIDGCLKQIVSEVRKSIGHAISIVSPNAEYIVNFNDSVRSWKSKFDEHARQYEMVKNKATSHQGQLTEIASTESRLRTLRTSITDKEHKLESLGNPEELYFAMRKQWSETFRARGDLRQGRCAELSNLSGGRIRAAIQRGGGCVNAQSRFQGNLTGTNIRTRKIEDMFVEITKSANPAITWDEIIRELESLISWNVDLQRSGTSPSTPRLSKAGFSEKELERISERISVDDWLELSLTELEDVPRFEYKQHVDTYISFEDASAGQQATALLRVLLNQSGPPLLIDQPEDDLDNQVILEVVNDIWNAKMNRQLIFSSHNANLVVNGDADLVVVCDYRTLTDQSGGRIKDQGAIDVERIRKEITTVMEGGKEAFRMRKEKYGF